MALQESLTQLAASSFELLRSRLALVALDLEDSAWQLGVLISMGVLAAALFALALVFASLAFVFAYWHSSPIWALSMVALAYGSISFVLMGLMFRRYRRLSFLMADSLEMIREDQQMLRDLT